MALQGHDHMRQATWPRSTSPNSHARNLAPDTVRDPLLGSINCIRLAILALNSRGLDVGNITSRTGLRDGNASPLLARQQIRQEPILQLFASKLIQWRNTKRHARRQT